jgi:two-component system response regulator RegA
MSPITWLLVDDDELFLATLARSLSRRGGNVSTVTTFEDAIKTYQPGIHERIVLDLNLAGDSGLALLSRIMDIEPQARIVMLTGYASVATAVEAIKRGAINYLCKPVTAAELISAYEEEVADTGDSGPLFEGDPLSIDQLEWEHIQRVLMDHDGNISATARALNMHRRTLQRKLQKRPSPRH